MGMMITRCCECKRQLGKQKIKWTDEIVYSDTYCSKCSKKLFDELDKEEKKKKNK